MTLSLLLSSPQICLLRLQKRFQHEVFVVPFLTSPAWPFHDQCLGFHPPTSLSRQTNIKALVMATKDVLVVYGLFAIVSALLLAKDISLWRANALNRLPPAFQDLAILRVTVTILFVIIVSLLSPVVLAISFLTIVIGRLASRIKQSLRHQPARRQKEQIADPERAISNIRNSDHWQNTNENRSRVDELSISSPYMVPLTEPPPVYTPYTPAHTIRQGQWRRASDRSAERHCFLLNDVRTPDELLRSSNKVTMIPSR